MRAPHVRFPRDQRKGTEKCGKVEAHVPAQLGQELFVSVRDELEGSKRLRCGRGDDGKDSNVTSG